MLKEFNEADANRAMVLEILKEKQPFILKMLEINGYSPDEGTLDDNNEPVKVYSGLPLFGENLFYSETAHASGVFDFRYFVPGVCPNTWLRDLPDGHFWNAADIILQTITALREKLYESQARQESIVCRLDEVLFKGVGVPASDAPAETAKKAVCHE